MSVFSFDIKNRFVLSNLTDEYSIMCSEFGKMIDTYHIKPEIYSDMFWDYLIINYDIGSNNILSRVELEVDEKNRTHKKYKYVVRCDIGKNDFIIISFYDEKKAYEDSDYRGYVSEDDKRDKVTDIIIYYNSDIIKTQLLEDSIVNKILDLVYVPTMKNQFFIISSTPQGYGLKSSYVRDMDIDLELNYGKKFVEIHDKIYDNLYNKKNGLFLFHGDSGTGKTTYIRKLISMLSEKKTIIYIPSYMMGSIADPELISFISNFTKTILLLEDAENVLTKHAEERTQAVANILNMTDGLLNDSLELQIIATFNVESKSIDPALTRAGRLVVNQKFKALSVPDANRLSKHINSNRVFDKPVTLAEIYEGNNQIVVDTLEEKPKIGFKLNN
ncbi:ATP-binding protein [bacterium]|nr:ATP-binding protein [bacterium]